ncbi:P-loop containing nucleoside triphosphate hydrolase protein [Aureobasidium pullulans]|uniref:P-loop containing nucleoside triphosphate hydrolase protein n=2 Tax=Aureobasidium pullulans TaxID=5580 RepID=A0A4S8Z3P9_AURPU|nr:P-loop containing nucleoside triphosphate hydrolase protein [Aureobasidium pullulans]
MLFVSQVLASPALEARQNSSNATASTSSSSSSTSSSSAASDTESGTPAGVGTGSSGSGEGSSGQNTVSDASLRYGLEAALSSQHKINIPHVQPDIARQSKTTSAVYYMGQSYHDLATRALACYQELPNPDASRKQDKRLLIAIGGPPGSGKGRIASKVAKLVNQSGVSCSVISIDGCSQASHNDTSSILPKSPGWTFKGAAAVDVVQQIQKQTTEANDIKSPFALHVEDVDSHALNVAGDASIVIFEGLYLLCEDLPWARISSMVNERWFVEIDPDVGRQRVIKRFLDTGFETDYEAACTRYDENDVFNAEFINRTSKARDVTIKSIDRRGSTGSSY